MTPEEITRAEKIQDEIKYILIRYGNPEFGDCIIDEICAVTGVPTTIECSKE